MGTICCRMVADFSVPLYLCTGGWRRIETVLTENLDILPQGTARLWLPRGVALLQPPPGHIRDARRWLARHQNLRPVHEQLVRHFPFPLLSAVEPLITCCYRTCWRGCKSDGSAFFQVSPFCWQNTPSWCSMTSPVFYQQSTRGVELNGNSSEWSEESSQIPCEKRPLWCSHPWTLFSF